MAEIDGTRWKIDVGGLALKAASYDYEAWVNESDVSNSEDEFEHVAAGIKRLRIVIEQATLDDIEYLFSFNYHSLALKNFYNLKIWQDERDGFLCLESVTAMLVNIKGRGGLDTVQPTTLTFRTYGQYYLAGESV